MKCGITSKKKKHKLWIWKVIDKFTGKLIHYVCGNRSAKTLVSLVKHLQNKGVIYYHTDGFKAYKKVIPSNQLYQGKDQTHQIERNNFLQRHYFARFRRKTCVVSRKIERVQQALNIFATIHVNKSYKLF